MENLPGSHPSWNFGSYTRGSGVQVVHQAHDVRFLVIRGVRRE